MSSQTSFTVPEGQSPPFAVVKPHDHAAWILTATALGLACFLFFTLIRVLVRATISHGFGADDYTLGAATVFAIIQSAVILGACSKGLGKTLDLVSREQQVEVQKMYYTSNLFFVMAIGLCKISVVCFLRRISRDKKHRLIFDISMGLIAAWTFASLLAVALQCDLQQPWVIVNKKCSGVLTRWQVIGAFDVITEAAIVGLVAWMVHSLQTPVSSKMAVVSIFSVRLILIVFIAFRMHTFDQAGYSENPFLREAPFIAWTQSELCYSLMSATIPVFQNFLKSLHTGFGRIDVEGGTYGYGSSSRSRVHQKTSSGYRMTRLRSSKSGTLATMDMDSAGNLTPAKPPTVEELTNGPSSSTTVQWTGNRGANGRTRISIDSDESRRLMIKKDVEWSVRTEPRE